MFRRSIYPCWLLCISQSGRAAEGRSEPALRTKAASTGAFPFRSAQSVAMKMRVIIKIEKKSGHC